MPNITIQTLSGQSNYDICLKTIGSLDGFVGLLSSNNITVSSSIKSKVIYNTNDILSKVIAGRNYCTGLGNGLNNVFLTDNGTTITDNGTILTDN